MRFTFWCALAMALVGCGGGSASSGGPSGGSESTRTLAYVVTQCREGPENADGFYGAARLEVRRVDADASVITIKEVPTVGPLPGLGGICQFLGGRRYGTASLYGSPFQRLGVSPDGSRIAFELTDDFSIVSKDQVPPGEEGIWVVGADGSGLRRLAPASREPLFDAAFLTIWVPSIQFGFSPSGDRITYADHGPAPDGQDAVQIMTLNIETGERRQITHLPRQPPSIGPYLFVIERGPVFVDGEIIAFVAHFEPGGLTAYTVRADGDEEPVAQPPPLTPGDGALHTGFLITDAARSVYTLDLGSDMWELFVSDGRTTLIQLTSFGRGDTGIEAVLSRDRQRVLFTAAGDAPGDLRANPYENCQLFSVDTLGGDLQQLTSFDEGQRSEGGCGYVEPRPLGCVVGIVGHDRNTDTILLESSCDPFGTNPEGGQIFAIEFDGTGLRQLTNTRGLETAADGTVTAELPGPAAYSGGL